MLFWILINLGLMGFAGLILTRTLHLFASAMIKHDTNMKRQSIVLLLTACALFFFGASGLAGDLVTGSERQAWVSTPVQPYVEVENECPPMVIPEGTYLLDTLEDVRSLCAFHNQAILPFEEDRQAQQNALNVQTPPKVLPSTSPESQPTPTPVAASVQAVCDQPRLLHPKPIVDSTECFAMHCQDAGVLPLQWHNLRYRACPDPVELAEQSTGCVSFTDVDGTRVQACATDSL